MIKDTKQKQLDHIADDLFTFANHDVEDAERTGFSNYSYWKSTWRAFISSTMTKILLGAVILLILFTLIQPFLPGQKSPTTIFLNPETNMQLMNQQPNDVFWFGTNSIGQDIWARIWAGTRTSLFIAFVVAGFEIVIGIIIGALWGYVRKLDSLITEVYNVMNNIPITIILVLLTYIMRPSVQTMIIAMCLTSWMQMARFVRNQIIVIRDREYNLASRCLGTPVSRIITKNLLPYLISVIMLRIALTIPSVIGYEVFLTYIGLGLPVSIPSLGNLLNEGRTFMMVPSLRYQLIFPAIVLSFITIAFYVLGNSFADASDPKNHH